MANHDPQDAPQRGSAFGKGVMLLIGLLVGIALAAAAGVFLLGIGWAMPEQARTILQPSISPTPAPTASAAPSAGSGTVPEVCARSARYNVEIDKGIDDLARSTQAKDAKAVQEALDRLQDARDNAKGAGEQCLALSNGGAAPTASAPAQAPTPAQAPATASVAPETPAPSPSATR